MNIQFIESELKGLRNQAFLIQGAIQAYEVMLKQYQSESITNGHDKGLLIEDIINEAIPAEVN